MQNQLENFDINQWQDNTIDFDVPAQIKLPTEKILGSTHTWPELLQISNADFVADIFRQLPQNASALVCSKVADPEDGVWSARPAALYVNSLPVTTNTYINCASFRADEEGKFRAKVTNSAATHFIMLDDIGTKVDLSRFDKFKLSWLIETSPGNHQAGIILDPPVADKKVLDQLMTSIIGANLCDSGSRGPATRWARLPVGINGKPKYKLPSGKPFQCRLLSWNPEHRYTIDQIVDGLGLPLLVAQKHSLSQKAYLPQQVPTDADSQQSMLIELRSLLAKIDASCEYDQWLKVLMGIHHSTNGSDDGLALANEWSTAGDKYKGPAELNIKWRSFEDGVAKPVTILSIRAMASSAAADIAVPTMPGDDEFVSHPTEVIPQSHRSTIKSQNFKVCQDGKVSQGNGIGRSAEVKKFSLDNAAPLPLESFPNPPRSGSQVPCTIPNILYLLNAYGIIVRYDVVAKKLLIKIPGHSGTYENASKVALTQINSLAALNGIPHGQIPDVVDAIGDREEFNPVADWIRSLPWDGYDRLPSIFGTLTVRDGYPTWLKGALIKRWLLSAVAAVFKPSGFSSRGVLTLQGPQALGKTSWFKLLVSDAELRERVIKLGHHLDAGDKDSKLTAVGHWLVEIGELDSSFKKDIARLKGFLTDTHDKIRRPYGRGDSEYRRMTVFCASVNDSNFLIDTTGNSRWWTLPVVQIDFNHGIDMQQVFAQLLTMFDAGEQWWLTPQEEAELDRCNREHQVVSAIYSQLIDAIDIDRVGESGLLAMTASEVLKSIGVKNPTNSQAKEAGAFLRKHFGEPRRINGRDSWRVPFRENAMPTARDYADEQ